MPRKKLARVSTPMIDIPAGPAPIASEARLSPSLPILASEESNPH
ncbi:Uncharacterised protein [uncultured archaeon]|nr:Uncharacterised protein [uncultured archaeon]